MHWSSPRRLAKVPPPGRGGGVRTHSPQFAPPVFGAVPSVPSLGPKNVFDSILAAGGPIFSSPDVWRVWPGGPPKNRPEKHVCLFLRVSCARYWEHQSSGARFRARLMKTCKYLAAGLGCGLLAIGYTGPCAAAVNDNAVLEENTTISYRPMQFEQATALDEKMNVAGPSHTLMAAHQRSGPLNNGRRDAAMELAGNPLVSHIARRFAPASALGPGIPSGLAGAETCSAKKRRPDWPNPCQSGLRP